MTDIQTKGADEVFCSSCGAVIKKEAEICPKCGVRQKEATNGLSDIWAWALACSPIYLFVIGNYSAIKIRHYRFV
jgi:predicted amidophosphoribosyltransferase